MENGALLLCYGSACLSDALLLIYSSNNQQFYGSAFLRDALIAATASVAMPTG